MKCERLNVTAVRVSGYDMVSAAAINSTVRFRCKRPSHTDVIRWSYYRHSLVGTVELFNGRRLTRKYRESGRYSVQCADNADECLLTINTVQTRDEGEYNCVFTQSRQRQSFWLVVVGKQPVLSRLTLELLCGYKFQAAVYFN